MYSSGLELILRRRLLLNFVFISVSWSGWLKSNLSCIYFYCAKFKSVYYMHCLKIRNLTKEFPVQLQYLWKRRMENTIELVSNFCSCSSSSVLDISVFLIYFIKHNCLKYYVLHFFFPGLNWISSLDRSFSLVKWL